MSDNGLITVSTPREILEVINKRLNIQLRSSLLTLHNKIFFLKKSGREKNEENILKVNMHLLLHPSAWSDRADDEAENDILAMQVDRSQMQVQI